MTKNHWISIRQRAGPLVKEVRYQRPTLSKGDLPSVRREKNEIIRSIWNLPFRRTPEDRLELMLALFGFEGMSYRLSFNAMSTPGSFQDVRRVWRNFLNAMKRHLKRSFDYVYVIEGRHGDHRYHIHLVVRYSDFTPDDMTLLWPGGEVYHVPLLLSPDDTYLRTARYFTKERTDGVVLPIGCRTWVASRSLYKKLPPPEKTMVTSGDIQIEKKYKVLKQESKANPFGEYRYAVSMLKRF